MSSSRLQVNQLAPQFVVLDLDRRSVAMPALNGRKTLLSFYRYVTCPLCNLRVARLMQEQASLESLDVVAVFESTAANLRAYLPPKGVPMQIVADPEGSLFRLYGVERSWLAAMLGMMRLPTMMQALFRKDLRMGPVDGAVNRVPADFLIDELGAIVAVHYGTDIADHMPLAEIQAFAAGESPLKAV